MSQSPTHKFGQIIGDVLEAAIRAPLAKVASRYELYLDCKRPRDARGGRSKVGWDDFRGNRHDLDYVLEIGGTDTKRGSPKAFIEIAYRRYTKHSRNKAQEIQGATAPLSETYAHDHPFIGAVLAGDFTDGSLRQLRSHGFAVLYIPFESVVKAFKVVGIDAYSDEGSKDADVQAKVDAWDALPLSAKGKVGTAMRKIAAESLAAFLAELEKCLMRAVSAVFVLALHGQSQELPNVESAIAFIEEFEEERSEGRFVRYEVDIRYTNKDEIRGTFALKTEAIKFLRAMA